jgi:hypothetical protein
MRKFQYLYQFLNEKLETLFNTPAFTRASSDASLANLATTDPNSDSDTAVMTAKTVKDGYIRKETVDTYSAMQTSITADPTTKRDFFVSADETNGGAKTSYRYDGTKAIQDARYTDLKLSEQLTKGNSILTKAYSKIAAWAQTGSVNNPQSQRNINPSVLDICVFGDSTGGRVFYDGSTGAIYRGAFMALVDGSRALGGNLTTSGNSGDVAGPGATAGLGNSDYNIFWNGGYFSVGMNGTPGVLNFMASGQVDFGTDKGVFAVVENDNVTSRAFTFALTNSAGTPIAVNGITGSMSVDCKGAALGIKKVGFCFLKFAVNAATGGTYKLSFGGLTTGNIAYNATAATVQSALEGLHASLVGNVGVSLSSTTYTVLIVGNGLPFTWQSITADVTNLTPTTAAYISWSNAGLTKLMATATAGTSRMVYPHSVERTSHGVAVHNLSLGGLYLTNINSIDNSIATTILSHLKPSLCSLQEYIMQAGTDAGTAASNLQTFITKTNTAWTGADWVHMQFCPTVNAPDEMVMAANIAGKEIVENAGRIWIDAWLGVPSYAAMVALGWQGDGIHFGYQYAQYLGGIVQRQLGFYGIVGLSPWTVSGSILKSLKFSNGFDPTLSIESNTNSGILKILQSNWYLAIANSAGSNIALFSTFDTNTGSFIPNPMRLGSSTGPQWRSGTGTPEGVITAPVGSMFFRTDGGAGTTFYVKESGTGNTGWIAK